MKHFIIKVAKKIFRVGQGGDVVQGILSLETELSKVNSLTQELKTNLGDGVFKVSKLQNLLKHIENYQPIYGLKGLVDTPARDSQDRCYAILDHLGDVANKRILDIGSSLGYFSFFFAERGAAVTGWEANPMNAEVARLAGEVNGINVDFLTKELDTTTIKSVTTGQFDVAFVLSVFHHIIRFKGMDETKKIVADLLERVPVLVVELAKKGEDPNLPWDKSQPKNELDIFEGLDVSIIKIGSFGNHLSNKKRPMYVVTSKKQITVNGRNYAYEKESASAYTNSPLRHIKTNHRKYYFSGDYIIKEYGLIKPNEKRFNLPEVVTEVSTLNSLAKLAEQKNLKARHPRLVDAEINNNYSRIIIKREPGVLLSDILTEQLTTPQRKKLIDIIIKDVGNQIAELNQLGLHHNDVTSWNVIIDQAKGRAILIDYANVSPVPQVDDSVALLHIARAIITGNSEKTAVHKDFSAKEFTGFPEAEKLYKTVITRDKQSGRSKPT